MKHAHVCIYSYIYIYGGRRVGGRGRKGRNPVRAGPVQKKSGTKNPVRSGKNPVRSGPVRDENPVRSERSVPVLKIIVKSGPVRFWYIPAIELIRSSGEDGGSLSEDPLMKTGM